MRHRRARRFLSTLLTFSVVLGSFLATFTGTKKVEPTSLGVDKSLVTSLAMGDPAADLQPGLNYLVQLASGDTPPGGMGLLTLVPRNYALSSAGTGTKVNAVYLFTSGDSLVVDGAQFARLSWAAVAAPGSTPSPQQTWAWSSAPYLRVSTTTDPAGWVSRSPRRAAAATLTQSVTASAADISANDKWIVPAGYRWRVMRIVAFLSKGDSATGGEMQVSFIASGNADLNVTQSILADTASQTVAASYVSFAMPAYAAGTSGATDEILGAEGLLLQAGDKLRIVSTLKKGSVTPDKGEVDIVVVVEEDS